MLLIHFTPHCCRAVAEGHGSEEAKVVRSKTVGGSWMPRSKSTEGLPQSAPSASELIRGNKPVSSANDRSSPAPAKPVSTTHKLKPWGRKEPVQDKGNVVSPAKPSTRSEAGHRRDKQQESEKGPGKPDSVGATPTAKEPASATGAKTAVATRESPSRKLGKQHSPKSEASSEKSSSPKLAWWSSSSKKAASHESPTKQETVSSATAVTGEHS